jgi:hypothetical protein
LPRFVDGGSDAYHRRFPGIAQAHNEHFWEEIKTFGQASWTPGELAAAKAQTRNIITQI